MNDFLPVALFFWPFLVGLVTRFSREKERVRERLRERERERERVEGQREREICYTEAIRQYYFQNNFQSSMRHIWFVFLFCFIATARNHINVHNNVKKTYKILQQKITDLFFFSYALSQPQETILMLITM